MRVTAEEVLEEFAEAATRGRRYRDASMAFGSDMTTQLRVIGGGRMPWGDDRDYDAWLARQVPVVRSFFARVIAERALAERAKARATALAATRALLGSQRGLRDRTTSCGARQHS